jgi:3'-phosphoadenosine 5'-phosphosulfate sulfotransferase (PAPS reductase)/FAD synthetase
MIELEELGIEPPEEAVQHPVIDKPEPSSDSLYPFEIDSIISERLSNGRHEGLERGVLFSGGDDSLSLAHYVIETLEAADFIIHLATNTSLPENIDYIREVCAEYRWPLMIIKSPMTLSKLGYRYGFPGPDYHNVAFQYLKGRQLQYIHQQMDPTKDIKFFSGVRKDESDRRLKNIEAEVQYESISDGNFDGWWLSPLLDMSDEEVLQYRREHGLPRNPVAEKIHRSGDCFCLAYGNRTEELLLLEAEYPKFAKWLKNVERRVGEYRGRLKFLSEEYPNVKAKLDTLRKQTQPHPFRLTILKDEYPDIYDWVTSISPEKALRMGRTEATSFIGHGGMSSAELRSLVAEADISQETLCETCGGAATEISGDVERLQEQAKSSLSAIQTELNTMTPDADENSCPVAAANGTGNTFEEQADNKKTGDQAEIEQFRS